MRPNQNQDSGEQKKSVFDRLGRQLDTGRAGGNRRSPAQYGDHQSMHPGMHDPHEFGGGGGGGRYMRRDGHPEMDWRYQQNDRRNMAFGRDRHPQQVGPPPPMPMPMPPPHYEMDGMPPGRQPPPYYQHPPPPPPHFPPGPPGIGPQMMGGPDGPMPMGMHHQRRPSPKYDRHGNPIRGPMRAEQPHGMTPPRNFMGGPMVSPMMPPGPFDMPMPMRPGMYPPGRWPENGPEMGPQMHGGRGGVPDDRFMEPPNRFMHQQQQQQQMKPPMMMIPEMGGMPPNFEAPRYSKWRERRDVITNLDRQTAQSSSKTDSLKSSLQHNDHRGNTSKKSKGAKFDNQQSNANKQSNAAQIETGSKEKKEAPAASCGGGGGNKTSNKDDTNNKSENNQDISDGEIVDDEDSSDDSDAAKDSSFANSLDNSLASHGRQPTRHKPPFSRKPVDGHPGMFEPGKRRRLHDRDEYSTMDYETISDEELNDFMSDKKDDERPSGRAGKNSSEIELLNALGLDWANLIELTKQSRKDTQTSDSALRRFALANYLPTLGITRELAGPEIYHLLMKVVQ